MNPGQNELNIIQFVEEIYRSMLRLQKIEDYKPVGSYEKEIINSNSYGVLYAFSCIYDNIIREYDRHLRDVVSVLQANPRRDYYVHHVGEYFYFNAKFSWHHLRVFLSHIIAIASLAYKQKIFFLSDDLVYTTAAYLETFKEDMKRAGGWPAFEQDCLLIAMKMEGKGGASKSGNSSKQNTKKARPEPKLSNVLLVKEWHYTAFNNQTFGTCHDTFDFQVYKLDDIYASCAHDYSKLHLFSLLKQDDSDIEGACVVCNGTSSISSKVVQVHNIIPKKECCLSTHLVMISVWTLNEMQRECPLLDLSHVVA